MLRLSVLRAMLLVPLTLGLELVLELAMFLWRKVFPPPAPSHAVPGTSTPKHTAIYRHRAYPDGVLERPAHVPQNLLEAFKRTVRKHPQSRCLGARVATAEGTSVGGFVWQSYEQVAERMQHFSSGLEYLGMLEPNDQGLRMLALYAKNRPECIIAEYAAYMRRATTVPFYETFDQSTIEYIMNHTELPTVVCSDELLSHVMDAKPSCPHLKFVVRMDSAPNAELKQKCKALGIELYTFEEVEQLGRENPREMLSPQDDDIATFCYTSGTTGVPKAAMISHANLGSVVNGVAHAGIHLHPSDRHLSYLPLAHTLERIVTAYCLGAGACIGFYQGDVKKLVQDLQALRPTIFVSVPRLFNRMYEGIMAKVSKNPLMKLLVQLAIAHKTFAMRTLGTTSHWIWDPLVFHKIAEGAGLDQCRLMACGSAPIATHVLDFVRVAFSCPVMEGYGCTESTALITITDPSDFVPQQVGGPAPHVEVRLSAVEDMGYLPSDRSHRGEPCLGRGEVCFRGQGLFQGYYKMSDKTELSVDEEGWFHTGDIGVWLPGGRLRIVDRQKNMFKLAQGEYIVPDKVENVYNDSEYVSQSFLYGDSMQHACVVVVAPEEEPFRRLARETLGPEADSMSLEQLCEKEELKKKVLEHLVALGKERRLNSLEQAKAIHLTPEQFTIENGLLTPTYKVKREVARERYKEAIKRMYSAMGGVAGKHVFQE